jgi:hypothetical protein
LQVHAADGNQAPRFEVDPMWPKPLPNHWLLGQTIGISVDSNDDIWIIHRARALDPKEVYAAEDPPASKCCLPAPGACRRVGQSLSRQHDPQVHAGRQPGEFYAVHSIATDSKGNIFSTETYHGQRVQKFVYKGLAPITKPDQGVLWPKAAKSPM